MNALGNQSDDLAWLHDWSPYSWAFNATRLDERLGLARSGCSYGVAAALLVVGWLVFRRRDIAI